MSFLDRWRITVREGDREIHHNRKTLWSLLALPAIVFAVACFAFSAPAHAAQTVPYKINFQGRITNNSGTVLPNGLYNMKFRIYDASSGGTLKWNEDRLVAATQAVQVTNGLFSVQLGDIANTLTPTIFTTPDLYLEVELPTLATATTSSPSWTEGAMSRSKFGSATYAFNSDTLDGLDAGAFSQLSTANAFTNTNSITVASNVNTFVVAGSTNLFRVDTSATSRVVIGTSDTTGTLLVLDEKTDTGDPTGTIGAMYYNSNAGKFRCYQVSAWVDCVGANYALSNLTTTSINLSLIAGTTNSIDLGSSSKTWQTGYFGTSVATPALRPLADSATALQIQNTAGSATYLTIDTVASAVKLGSTSLAGKLAVSDGSSNYVTLSVNALANDYTISIPTITANDTMCLSANANCATNLQTAYNISTGTTTPEIKVNGTKGGITIQDADSTITGTLFSVTQSNASNLGVAIFSVDSTGAASLGLAGTTTTLAGNISSTGTFSSTGATALFKPSSAATNAFQVQNSSALVFLSVDTTSANKVSIGLNATDTNQILLQLDSFDTFADTGTCATTTNQGGLYYNTKTNAVRACINGGWEDMVSTASLGLQLFGVVPDSGLLATQGDIYGVSSATGGPCKVSVGSSLQTVSWTACTAFSGGRKVIVAAGTQTALANSVAGNFEHLCLTAANGQPTLSASGAENANLVANSFASAAAPILCLADIKFGAANNTITEIYDTRTYTTTDKTFVALNSAIGIGTIVIYSGTKGVVAQAGGANVAGIAGVIVATTGAAQTTTINAIMATGGPAAVKATGGTLNQYIFTTATAGYAASVATKPTEGTGTIYNLLGNVRTAYSSACAINSDSCAGSLMTDIDKR